MPQFCDRNAIRRMLRTDTGWSVFALGDLVPPYFERCAWYRPASDTLALAMIYRGFEPPVLFAFGDAGPVLEEIDAPAVYLHMPEAMLPAVEARYREVAPKPMWRMVLVPDRYRPESGVNVERLDAGTLPALLKLYADGESNGEAPGFFLPEMLADGTFFGVREGGEWVAAAGTQLVAPAEGVAAIGNVYTRGDSRGRGLAGAVTTAVVDELLRRDIANIALNVSRSNTTAVRVYERLGFVRHCGYVEGIASGIR